MELSETIEVIRTNIETLVQQRCLVTVVRLLPFLQCLLSFDMLGRSYVIIDTAIL